MTPRYIMVGGFLGAGKTTAILRLAQHYHALGFKVGLITNDQSTGLVDTKLLSSHQFPVEEITGGCFCCRFDSLTEAANKLSASERPEILLAEPVGSCTDLTATVNYPLRRLYGDNFSIAPYSVLVDPVRAERMLGLAAGAAFSPKVAYIYGKQLEEAEILIVNKRDTLDDARAAALVDALSTKYPQATVLTLSARDGAGVDKWADRLAARDLGAAPAMEVDYDAYAEGEALLGWVNVTAAITSDAPFDGNLYLAAQLGALQQHLQAEAAEVAHLKATLTPDEGADLAVANLVRTEASVEFSHRLQDTLAAGEWIVNLRAEADPARLEAIVRATLARPVPGFEGVAAAVLHLEAFRPGRPVPTHRLTEA